MSQHSFLAEYGPGLLTNGYPIVPIKPHTKYPGYSNWQETQASTDILDGWLSNGFANGGVGVLTRWFPAADLDVRDARIVKKLIEWCEKNIGPTVQRVGYAPKVLLVYRTDEPFSKIASNKYVDFLGLEHKVEILGNGQQFVAYAFHPDTGKPYEWGERGLADTVPSDLPVITLDQAKALIAYFESIVPDDWELVETASVSKRIDVSIPETDRALFNAKPKTNTTPGQLGAALARLDPDMRMHEWVRIGMALFHQFDGSNEGFGLWDEWSAKGSKYNSKEMRQRWHSFKADVSNTNPVTAATILQLAKQAKAKKERKDTGFHFINIEDILADTTPSQWRIKGFLEEDTTGLIFGDPGTYKSFLAIDMACHVATGKDWHGCEVKQGPVIYVAGEGHKGLRKRFVAWEQHHNTQLAGKPIYVSSQAAQFYDGESAQQVVAGVDEIARHSDTPALIIIDTLARNFGPGDENSNNDMGLFLNHVDGLLRARFGATVLIVHHTGHSNKERARGAMALKGAIDFEYRLEKTGTGRNVRMCCTRMKDEDLAPDKWFEGQIEIIGTFEDDDITSLVLEPCAPPVEEEKPLRGKQAALYELITKEAPIDRDTLRDVALAGDDFKTPEQVRDTLRQLKKKELAVENDGWVNTVDAFFGAD